MSRISHWGRRSRIALAAVLVGGLALVGLVLAPSAGADQSAQATVSRGEMLQRAAVWLTADNGSQVPYSQTRVWSDGYRQDCSGFVSMTLKLGTPGPNTVELAGNRDLTSPISLSDLEPGDLLIDAQGGNTTRHVVIFAGWTDSSHTAYDAYEQRGGHGTDHRVLTYGLDAGSEFLPYRPTNLTDGGETPDPPTDSWPTLKSGSSGVDVQAAQHLLTAKGFDTEADGDFGPLTEDAVTAFQSAKGLTVDGEIGPQTWSALIVTVSQGSSGEAVKAVQRELDAHGAELSADGDFGPLTTSAVTAFQRDKGLSVDGVVGPQTWLALIAA